MAAAVRRLSFLTPETVLNRRASCDPLNLSTRCLEAKPEFSKKRRASVGTFDTLLPYPISRGKSNEKRASLCVPNYDTGPPSVAYLSRKRASLDNIFLSEWIQPGGLSKSQIELDRSFETQKEKPSFNGLRCDAIQRKSSSIVSPVFRTSNDSSACISSDALSNASLASVFNHSPSYSSPNYAKPKTSSGYGTCQTPSCQTPSCQTPSCQTPLHQTPDKPCDYDGRKSFVFSPSSSNSNSLLSKSFQDRCIDKTFTPHLPPICRTPKHLSKDVTQGNLALGHLHERSAFQEHLYHRSCSRISSYGGGDAYSSKTRSSSHRKRSSPCIVFPSLSPCIEAKSKSDHFIFEKSQVQNEALVSKEEIQKVSVGENEFAVDAELFLSIPKICIDTVHSDDDGCQESDKKNSKASPNFLADISCDNSSYSPTCMQCCRRRFSLEVQPSRLRKKVNLGSFASRPLTPQSIQLHGQSFHHHRRLSGSELYSSNNTFSNTLLKREATLSYSNLILKPVGSVINRGGFGVVKLGHFKGKHVAIKVLKGKRQAQSALKEALLLKIQPQAHVNSTLAVVTSSTSKDFANISWAKTIETSEEEVLPLKSVSSLFGIPMQDISYPYQEDHGCNEAIDWAWVVSELCSPYTLLTLINEPNIVLTARDKVRFIGEIANGLSYLHSQNLVHLDVKPANVLLAHTGHIKLADFGCCSELYGEKNEHVLGTINYQAPEVLRGKEITDRCDVFSLGITAWHLLTQVMPFQGTHPHIIIYQVTKLLHRPVDHFPVHISSYTLLEQLLNSIAVRCWAEDPMQRPSASVVSANLAALYLSPAA